MNILFFTFITLLIIYLLFKPTEKFDNNEINQQLLDFLKNNEDISFIIYAKFLNENKNTNPKLVSIDAFKYLTSLGQNITINDINEFN